MQNLIAKANEVVKDATFTKMIKAGRVSALITVCQLGNGDAICLSYNNDNVYGICNGQTVKFV